ncbi:MAG: sulfatase [Pirellulales bacterium]
MNYLRNFLKTITIVFCVSLFLFMSLPLQAKTKHPNIVFFLVDDLGWRDVGCFGSSFYDTPNIDQLASESTRFTSAYAACHVCSPTRASILTGKYPARLALTDWIRGRRDFSFQPLNNVKGLQQLPLDEQTLAETLKAAGYRTAAIGKWHLGAEPSGPTAHGFDVDIPRNHSSGGPRTYHAPFKLQGIEGNDGDYLTDRLTDKALEFIETSKGKPFFLYLAHFAVHDPIQGRKDLVEKYRKKLEQMKPAAGPDFVLEGNPDSKKPLTKQQLAELIKLPSHKGNNVLPQHTVKIKQHQDNIEFAGMVESMDESLGRVMAKLKALNLEDNTIVIFFSDNGGMAGANVGNPNRIIPNDKLDVAFSTSNLPLRGAKGWLYEGGIRVPMIVKWPSQANQPAVCDVPVISTDFYPSILEMAGLPALPKQHADGVSFTTALQNKPFERKPIFWHFPHYSNHGMQPPSCAVRAGDYKLIEYFENDTVQLFNLKNDIGEQVDLASSEPAKTNELRSLLHQWRTDVGAKMNVANPDYDPTKYPHQAAKN